MLTLGAQLFPARFHLLPQQRREQEAGADALAGAHARVGAFQRQFHEMYAAGLFQHHVQQRQQAVMQAVGAQLAQAVHGMAAGQQLEHFVEQARSEEHTSELQSLMRISYAVFCLKKKKKTNKKIERSKMYTQ